MKRLFIAAIATLASCAVEITDEQIEQAPMCVVSEDCDDGDACTADRCSKEGECVYSEFGGGCGQ